MHYLISQWHGKSQISTETYLNVPEAAKVSYRQSLRQFIMLISSRTRRAIMSTIVKLGFASLIACRMISGTCLASPPPAYQQTTPAPSAEADKQTNTPAKVRQPHPNPDAAGKYHVGDGVTAPILIHSEEPNIPQNMRKANIPGSCLVALTVDTNGYPTDMHVVRSTPDPNDKGMHDVAIDLQNFCIEGAQKYRFRPGTFQGKPVPVDLKLEISYRKF